MHVILRCIEPHFESTLKNNGKLMARLQNAELSLFPQFLVILQFKKRQTDKRKRKKQKAKTKAKIKSESKGKSKCKRKSKRKRKRKSKSEKQK